MTLPIFWAIHAVAGAVGAMRGEFHLLLSCEVIQLGALSCE